MKKADVPRRRSSKRRSAREKEAPTPPGPRPAAGVELPGWLPPLVFGVLTLLLFREFVFAGEPLLGVDTLALGYFAREFYTEAVRELGIFPLWDPLLYGGMPFVDAMHGDIFYPVSLALFFLDAAAAWGWKLVLHVFLAGVFQYLWLRQIGLTRAGAFLGGLSYMLATNLVSLVYPGHDGKIFVTAVTPLAFLAIERAVRFGRLADFAWLALAVALLLYTAHMQLAYFAVWGISLYFFFRLYQLSKEQSLRVLLPKRFLPFVVAGLMGTAAAAVQLVPPFLYLREWSHRTEKTVEAEGDQAFAYATSFSLHPEEAAALLVPEFVGVNLQTPEGPVETYWGRNAFKLNHEYAGFLPLFLAPLLFLRRRRSQAWFFATLAALALLYALGANTPVFGVFYALIPGVKLFRAPSTIMFLFAFAVATLGALGWERFHATTTDPVEDRRSARRYLWAAAGFIGFLAVLASAGALVDLWRATFYASMDPARLAPLERNAEAIRTGFWITFLLAAATAGAWEARTRGWFSDRVLLALVTLLLIFDLWRVDRPFVRATTAIGSFADPVLFAPDESLRYLQGAQARGEVFRVFDLGLFLGQGAYPPNAPAIHGLEQLAGHHGNEIGRYRAVIGGEHPLNALASELRLLNLLNVGYVLSPQPVQVPGLEEVYRGSRSIVYANRNVLPRAFIAQDQQVIADDSVAIERMLAADFAPRTAILPAPIPGFRPEPAAAGDVRWIRRAVNEHRLQATTDRPSLLLLTDNFYPAWKATVDGREAPILRANVTFRAIPLGPGEHEVVLTAGAGWVRPSAIVSGLLLTGLLVTGLFGVWRGRRQSPDAAR